MIRRYLLLAVLALGIVSGFSQAPVNDVCTSATPLTVNGGYITVNNSTTVTNGSNPSCGGSGAIRDIWFSFVFTGGNIVVETQLGTNTDTRIAVYTSCGGTQLACNDDYGGTYRSYIALACSTLTVGNTYIIQAGGYNQVVGAFQIQVTSSGSLGCTDPMATNFSPCAVTNDGSCVYPVLTAQFGYAPTGQNCLNIQYTSTSSGNITGYDWTFPGGNPSTSTAQNPVVTYASPGTYSASLTVSDLLTENTVTNNNVQVSAGEFVTVDITPDANPAQTSWSMLDENDAVIASGTSNDASFCIANNCHKFVINDSGGNGLTGSGNYKVYLNGILVASGATFSSQDIRFVNCPLGISCDHAIVADTGLVDVPFDNSWYTFTAPSTGQYRISTCDLATCDTKIWVYDYCTMANFDDTNEATYTYNDEFCGVQAEVNVFMAAGNTYYVRVGSSGECAGEEYQVLFEYGGAAVGCMDVLACNYNPLAGIEGPCYYNGDPNCSNLGPDLAVNLTQMYNSLVTSTIANATDACYVNEGCLQGLGARQILKFTTYIGNEGNQDYYIGVPNASNPQFEYDACHNHYHYEGYAEYLLYNQDGEPMPDLGFKNGFCVLDLTCPTGISAQYSCGNMGITAGCADYYSSSLSCQWIDITDVPAGDYFLVVRTNWDHSPDALGRYELRYDNNWAQVCIHFDRDPVTNAITNFSKNINTCPAIEDCLGTPFGDVYADCEGNCPGTTIKGDFNQDGYFTAYDEHLYAEASVYGGTAVTPCNDLNNDGEITVADAAYAGSCVHQQEDLGVPPLQFTSCPWDNEFLDMGENVTLGLTNLNTTAQTFDLYIINPTNEVLAFQVDLDGAIISSLESLLPTGDWSAHLHFEANGNTLAVMSNIHSEIPMYSVPTSVLRVHYSSLSSNTVCISNIVDVINDLVHNTLTTYGDCVSVTAPTSADFTASQTSVCAGGSVNFTDISSGAPTSWTWTFPGGTPASSSSQNPTIVYNAPGTYNVSLQATGPGGNDTETKIAYIVVGPAATWYADADNDGFGNPAVSQQSCSQPVGFVNNSGDCDDASASVNPQATEICNGIDDDCDLSFDEGFDLDNDGYTTCDGDCNDGSALVYPGAFELCNGQDEDCDLVVDEGYDNDNDGYTACAGDCNDNNAAVHPGISELCNGIDDNCNGSTDEGFDADNDGYTVCGGDCNDNNNAVRPGASETCNNGDDDCDGSVDEGFDADGDGFTVCNGDCDDQNASVTPEEAELCNGYDDNCDGNVDEGFDADNDGYTVCEGDCNDASASVNPGATEVCNNIDDNCNGSADEGFDNDNDGYTVCEGDCNDNNNLVNPGATETCNGIDDNCNGSSDEGFDMDGDGFTTCENDCNDGDASVNPGAVEICNAVDDNCNGTTNEGFDIDGDGFSSCDSDCDDSNAAINPGALETCNGVDDDCDGSIDENLDGDGDGYSNCSGDCNDADAAINPGASELCNSLDDDCDGTVDEGFDTDNDGFTACQGDCNDSNASVHPGAAEMCNSSDDDCDGSTDEGFDTDGDGYTTCAGDCDDGNAAVNPGVAELCNGVNDDCDGSTDEGFDVDGDGYTSCNGDCDDNNGLVYPGAAETCNGNDDDCDGSVDEGFDTDGDGFTTCGGDCNDGNSAIHPGATETCNSTDDDCDEVIDDNAGLFYYQDSDADGYGNPNVSVQSCTQPAGYVTNNLDCYDTFPNRNPAALEFCNNIDDDCDGVIDDNCSNVANDFYANAVSLALYPVNQCTGTTGTVSGATVSAESQSTVVAGGQDVWYKFIATQPGIRCRVTTTTTDVLVELQDANGNLVNVENALNAKGSEYLNYTGLSIGQTYYVAVRNNNSALGAGSFIICINALSPGTCFNATGNYTLCGSFKANNIYASAYVYNFTSNTTGLTYSRTVSSTTCVLSTVPGLPAGDNYTARIDASYNLTTGSGAGEVLVVPGTSTCAVTIAPIAAVYLNVSQDCPSARLLGSTVRTNANTCSVLNYEWECQLADLSAPAFYVNAGTSNQITISTANGFALGQTYNVRIRSTIANGYTTPWGPQSCLVISGSGMVMEGDDNGLMGEDRDDVSQVSIYPNPNKGNEINLYVNEVNDGAVNVRIMDGMGRIMWTNKFVADSYLNTQIVMNQSLPSGIYVMELQYDGEIVTRRIVVQQ